MFPNVEILNLEFSRSNHRPLLINTKRHNSASTGAPTRKFEAHWLEESDFGGRVHQAWPTHPLVLMEEWSQNCHTCMLNSMNGPAGIEETQEEIA